jgi:hypothetical protein
MADQHEILLSKRHPHRLNKSRVTVFKLLHPIAIAGPSSSGRMKDHILIQCVVKGLTLIKEEFDVLLKSLSIDTHSNVCFIKFINSI